MIKINSFYPFSNFLRVSAEFHEEKAIIKTKSLTFEREHEFRYDQVTEIAYQSQVQGSQMMFGFVVLAFFGAVFLICSNLIYARPWLLQVIRALYVIFVIVFLTSFIKSRYYYFLGKNKKVLSAIKVTARNYKSIVSVIEWVGEKSQNLKETAFDHPFPDSQPRFELTDHDIPNYFNTCQTRFYEDGFIEFDKNLMGASASSYRYDELSSDIYHGKQASTSWDSLFWLTLAFSAIVLGFDLAFDILSRIAFLSVMGVLMTVMVISFLLKYVKHEIVAVSDKNDHVVYFTWVNRSNKEKVEKIIKFIQSKISPITND